MDFYNFYNAHALSAYYADVKTARGQLLGETLFPIARTTEMSVSWVKGYNAKNIVLQPAAFDTKAVIRSQREGERVQTELPLFKEAMVFTEEQRRTIISNISRYGEKIALDLMVPIYKQYGQLVDGAMVQAERMRMALVSRGQFVIEGNVTLNGSSVKYDVNYDPSGAWAANNNLAIQGTSQWTLANKDSSTPIDDLLTALQSHSETNGGVVGRILMNSTTLRAIMTSESIKRYMRTPISVIPTRAEVTEIIERETGATVVLYDKLFTDESGVTQKFFEDAYVSLLPSAAVGQTMCGTTPTEFDLLNNSETSPNVAITDEGIAIQTLLIKDPVNIETIVSATLMPSFEEMQSVFVIKGY